MFIRVLTRLCFGGFLAQLPPQKFNYVPEGSRLPCSGKGHQFRGRRFIDVNTTASKNELTSTHNKLADFRIYLSAY